MGSHAVLSPSAASRWLACTPSARLEQEFPNTSSSFADEGTLAHAVGEAYLREISGKISKVEHEMLMAVHIQNQYFSEELRRYAEEYAEFIWAMCEPGSLLYIEQKLDMSAYVPDGFGTGDALIVIPAKKKLIFGDLKYGKGVPVSAVDNKQLMLYALGAYDLLSDIYEIEEIEMWIYQPRLNNVSDFSISVKDLLKWAKKEVIPKAKLAHEGKGEYVPGKHCQFCKAKATCRKLADYNMEVLKYDFKHPDLLDKDEISEVLARLEVLTNWANTVQEYALAQSLKGETFPGYKVVEGRSTRKYSDEKSVESLLISKGFTDIYKPSALLGLGEMEKKIGKDAFAKHVADLLVKPKGKPTLVPESDKRAKYEDAASDDFTVVND